MKEKTSTRNHSQISSIDLWCWFLA